MSDVAKMWLHQIRLVTGLLKHLLQFFIFEIPDAPGSAVLKSSARLPLGKVEMQGRLEVYSHSCKTSFHRFIVYLV